jgi:TetR/AcrR family transcriptional regulator, lmrAB and yxaGH operons repressor
LAVKDRLINSAITLMRRNGVAATGISQLVEESGSARRSIYLNFPGGKAELIASATAEAAQRISAAIDTLADTEPSQAVAGFVAMWDAALVDSDFTAGCPIVAAALGRAEVSAAADLAGTAFTEWSDALAVRLRAAGAATETAAELATTIVAAIEGAVIMSLAARSTVPLQRTGAVISRLTASIRD